MNDSKKIKLIKKLISEGWECAPGTNNDLDFWKGVLMAIEVVSEDNDGSDD